MRRGFVLPLILLICGIFARDAAEVYAQASPLDWPPAAREHKPWTRWWWLGNILNRRDLALEMRKYQRAGLGGVEVTPIYGVRGYEDRFIDFLSPAWVDHLVATLDEAERLGLGVDVAAGTGWPFGGPWVGDEYQSRYFASRTYIINEGARLGEAVRFIQTPLVRAAGRRINISELKDPISANENLQALALDQVRFEKPLPLAALVGYSDRGEILDLTSRVAPDGALDWTAAPGRWKLYAIFQGWHGKMVERAAPGGEGYVIDHFSRSALEHHLKQFDRAFDGKRVASIRAYFNDSYEVDDAQGEANWTPNFLAEFERRRGYDLRRHLPALLGEDAAEQNERVRCDFRETISDLLLEEFTTPWREWARRRNAIIRNQAHGSPANLLDLYAASDIPETEGTDIIRMKFASSAAHVTGKRLVSSESATWLNEHTLATLGEVKAAVDRYFLGGINHVFYHGTPFSPESEPWPGWLFYAAVHFGPTNSFWDHFPKLNSYIARCQSFLQSGRAVNDVLVYYPIHDSWAQAGRGTLQHYGGGFDSAMNQGAGETLLRRGYSFDFISDRQIAGVKFDGAMLRTGSGEYKTIIVPHARLMPLATFEALTALAGSGATIIVENNPPQDVPGLADLQQRRSRFQSLIGQLRFRDESGVKTAAVGRGRFLLGDDLDLLLEHAGVARETMVDAGLRYVRRREGGSNVYFIHNGGERAVDGWVAIRAQAAAVVQFDPMRETSALAAHRRSGPDATEVYLQLEPGASCILRVLSSPVRGRRHEYFQSAGDPVPIEGEWAVKFVAGGPDLPADVKTGSLGSWTNFEGEDVKRFSGTARYTIAFDRPHGRADAWELDLGRVAESARVRLNGREIGVLISAPYRIRLPGESLRAKNVLEIEVANLMTNRIADMDRRGENWKRFYNVNMPARRRENAGPDGLFNAAKWALGESGLIGPVTLGARVRRVIPSGG
ncbi:MAG: glycoside hydrolase family 2 protein [Acidobacteria bacterium]|nr:glycoside hydrolase family 2 protein [Acidobacteriota bacterium]